MYVFYLLLKMIIIKMSGGFSFTVDICNPSAYNSVFGQTTHEFS